MAYSPVFLPASPDQEPSTILSVLSYNVLAQALISRSWFPYCGKKTLKWSHRSKTFLSEFTALDPDIACLQEVDQYHNFYKIRLESLGYDSVYYSHQSKKHGCCIAFKKEKYSLVLSRYLDLDNETSIPCTFGTGNILLLASLKPNLDSLPTVVIGTCHLFWSPDGSYERLRQSVIVTKALDSFRYQFPGASTILTGDFNLSPNHLPYQVMTRHSISTMELEKLSNSLKEELNAVNEELVANEDLIVTVKTGVAELKVHKTINEKFQSNKFSLLMSSDSEDEGSAPKESDSSEISKENIIIPDDPNRPVLILKEDAINSQDTTFPVNASESKTESIKGSDSEMNTKVNNLKRSYDFDKTTSVLDTLESLREDLRDLKGGHERLISRQRILRNIVPPEELIDILKNGPKFFSCYADYTKYDKTYHSDIWSELNEPCFTNYTEGFKSTLDYIFTLDPDFTPMGDISLSLNENSNKRKFDYIDQVLTTKRLKVDSPSQPPTNKLASRLIPHQLLALPPKKNLGIGFPDESHPSDHFPIMVRFSVDAPIISKQT